ncbi:hypothetical protein [Ferrimonas aestuarii]|uniref:Uncharacterized protein n=1 Tax=Ferrimonas aestuarii TaxID=2569539 RepID=A0A4U1BL49_9GAMM|nr:hypothetical protein [Ferrimonas aestuarii]TKB53274.1 hypothetical protein FCL42_14475 [Ferrimonas aestuarii]
MSLVYCGFDVGAMVNTIARQSSSFTLELVNNDEATPTYRLYAYIDGLGEFEMEGALSRVVIHAFKPLKDDAQKERERLENVLGLLPSRSVLGEIEFIKGIVEHGAGRELKSDELVSEALLEYIRTLEAKANHQPKFGAKDEIAK